MRISISVPTHHKIVLYFDWQKGKPIEFLDAVVMEPYCTLTFSADFQIKEVSSCGRLFQTGSFSEQNLKETQQQIRELVSTLMGDV
jgi:hypothetical protein